MPARVVCISYEIGAGGEEVGRIVSDRLGFHYFDEEIISAAAERGGVDAESLANAEIRKSLANRVVEQLFWAGVTQTTPSILPVDFTSKPYRQLIIDVIRATAEKGDAVIVAHAAGMALGGKPGVLRVSVTAPPPLRARRITGRDGLGADAAAKLIEEGDIQRASYFKRFYDVARELSTHYDLVVNTEVLDVEQAAALIVQAAGFERSGQGQARQIADAMT